MRLCAGSALYYGLIANPYIHINTFNPAIQACGISTPHIFPGNGPAIHLLLLGIREKLCALLAWFLVSAVG